jgi:hypothetical protein
MLNQTLIAYSLPTCVSGKGLSKILSRESSWCFDFRRLASIEKPWRWNELVTLSAKYCDLAANTQLALTVSHP